MKKSHPFENHHISRFFFFMLQLTRYITVDKFLVDNAFGYSGYFSFPFKSILIRISSLFEPKIYEQFWLQ